MNYESRAFIFDMDGTLVDNMRFHTEAWRTLIEENGHEFEERKFLVETAGQTNREIIPSVFGAVSNDRLNELALRKEMLYREVYIHHRKPVDGLIEFLDSAHGLGIKLAVSTAASPANMAFILDGLELRKYFGAITTAADVKRGKPDPEIFLMSAANVGVEPRHSIVFEDAFFGFEAAKRAGMKAIGITTVNSYEEIMRAEGVVEAHADFEGLDPGEIVRKYTDEH
ncbi:MAG: HAD family phosphatase [Pyrinomonadaceae bacterium]